MLKKITILIITCLFAMTALSGCSIIAEQNEKSLIEDALKERYGEEFVCMKTWNNAADGYYSHSFHGLCYPQNNESIKFEILFGEESGILYEGYYAAAIAEQIENNVEKALGNVFSNFYLHTNMTLPLYCFQNTDDSIENVKNDELSVNEYIKKFSEKYDYNPMITLVLCVDLSKKAKLSYKQEYKELSNIFSEIDKLGISTDVYLNFLPSNKYTECIEYLNNTANIDDYFESITKDYSVRSHNENYQNINFDYKGDTYVTITLEDYIRQREAMKRNEY